KFLMFFRHCTFSTCYGLLTHWLMTEIKFIDLFPLLLRYRKANSQTIELKQKTLKIQHSVTEQVILRDKRIRTQIRPRSLWVPNSKEERMRPNPKQGGTNSGLTRREIEC